MRKSKPIMPRPDVVLGFTDELGHSVTELVGNTRKIANPHKIKPRRLIGIRPVDLKQTVPTNEVVVISFGSTAKQCSDRLINATRDLYGYVGDEVVVTPFEGTGYAALCPVRGGHAQRVVHHITVTLNKPTR